MDSEKFFDSISAIRNLTSNVILIDNPLMSSEFNLSARILRHGLSVSSFALLEQYLHYEMRDFMGFVSHTTVPYSDMSEDFRRFVSISAATGLLNRIGFIPKTDRLTYFENEAPMISKFLDTPAQFNWHGFSPKGSNVGKDDIATALKAMGVDRPWQKLTRITSELGSHRADLASDFDNLARTRHTSAHNPTGNVATADLETNLTVSILIAISVSLVLRELTSVYRTAKSARDLQRNARDPNVNVRFLDEAPGGKWLEKANLSGRIVKRYNSLEAAIIGAKARKAKQSIVVRDISKVPSRIA